MNHARTKETKEEKQINKTSEQTEKHRRIKRKSPEKQKKTFWKTKRLDGEYTDKLGRVLVNFISILFK